MNQLILGDNLEIMRKMDSESIDLIYLDPPFFSNRNYEVIWGDKGEVRSFEDRWSGGIDHYIAWLKERVAEMHRLLKPTGSIYLHCDWHADAYIRVYILDKIFGENNLVSHIIWKRTTAKSISKKISNNTDSIFLYGKNIKNTNYIYNQIYLPLKEEMVNSHYTNVDLNGKKFTLDNLKAPGKGYVYIWNGVEGNWRCPKEKMQEYYEQGRIQYTKNGVARYVRYLEDSKGVPIDNNWVDIFPVNSQANERIGYPTQKPEKLIERIINASSNEGDIIFDPFVGGGTTVVVADKLKRNWIGIDQSVQAVKVTEMRLGKQQGLFSAPFSVQLHKYDYDTLRNKDAFEFEKWIVEQYGGIANIHQRGDMGMDGKTREGTPIQVKRSDNIGRNVVDNFGSACKRYDNNLFEKNKANALPIGFIIAFSFGKGAIQEVARLKNEENIIVKLITVDEIVPIAKKPKLSVTITDLSTSTSNKSGGGVLDSEVLDINRRVNPTDDRKGVALREIQFTATGESDSGIEFYSWDFDYNIEEKKFNPTILLDKDGKQSHKFKPGTHNIAVKVVDNEGLEALEVVKIKVNGVVERE